MGIKSTTKNVEKGINVNSTTELGTMWGVFCDILFKSCQGGLLRWENWGLGEVK